MPTKFAINRGHKIAYRIDTLSTTNNSNYSETIIMQHGWTSTKEAWGVYSKHFIKNGGYTCISIDSLAHGESDSPPEKKFYGRKQRAEDVVAVMNQENIEKAHFIGYSMGGWIGCCLAEFYPNRLQTLIIGGHCPETGTGEEISGDASKTMYAADFLRDPKISSQIKLKKMSDGMKHCFDLLEDVYGHEKACANAGVPVLIWKGKGETWICKKGEIVAKRNRFDFLSVDGDHIEAVMGKGLEASLNGLYNFIQTNSTTGGTSSSSNSKL
jgi:pimeloyl-ACP methyl ester carboxylesterase